MNSIFTTPKIFATKDPLEKYHYYPSPAIPQSSPLPDLKPSSPHFDIITPKVNLQDKWNCHVKVVNVRQEDTIPPDHIPVSHADKHKPVKNAASCQTSFCNDKTHGSNSLYPHNNRFLSGETLEPYQGNIPKPIMKDEITELLTNSCDTSENSATLSPNALKWYLNRFKNAAPTHASKRKCAVGPSVELADPTNLMDCTNTVDPTNFSDISNFSSVDTSASSFFNLRISDNTTTSYDTSPDLTISSREEIVPLQTNTHIPDKPVSYSLQFEEIFGKKFDEVLELVPSEIVNPSSDENDILFQWRLKRAMEEAKSAPILVADIPDYMMYSGINARNYEHYDEVRKEEVKPSEPVQKVLREMNVQTDKELVTTSCQVESDLEKQITDLNETRPEDNIPVIKVQSQNQVPQVVTEALQKIEEEEEEDCDFDSLSSYSDDLTVVSDLDDANETILPHSKDLVFCSDEQLTNNLPINQQTPQSEERPDLTPGIPFSNITPEAIEKIDDQSDELLRAYLQNILDSFDDPILASFIDRYDVVQKRISVVDQLIEEKDSREDSTNNNKL